MQQQYGTPGDGSLAQASNMGGYDSGTGSMDMGAMSGFGDMAGGASMLLDDPLALAGLDDDFLALQQLPASSSSTMVGQLLQHGSIILGRQIKVYQQMEGRWFSGQVLGCSGGVLSVQYSHGTTEDFTADSTVSVQLA
mmetsp:Transcript_29024/g.64045  ORF Transcript_29024/g.64045 Transcript_29024/m.64045 type:complete len:138 (-) Transcript_29024:1628-2041(-)